MTLKKLSVWFDEIIDTEYCFKFAEPYSSRADMIQTATYNIFLEPIITSILVPVTAIIAIAYAAKSLFHPQNRIENLKEARYFTLLLIAAIVYAAVSWLIRTIEVIIRLCHSSKAIKKITAELTENTESMVANVVAQ